MTTLPTTLDTLPLVEIVSSVSAATVIVLIVSVLFLTIGGVVVFRKCNRRRIDLSSDHVSSNNVPLCGLAPVYYDSPMLTGA